MPMKITLTASSEIENEPTEWTRNGAFYTRQITKLDVQKIGNKELLEIFLELDIIPDGTISGWSLVEYLQTSGSSMDEDTIFQQGVFLVKRGQEPVDLNDILGYSLTEREVESSDVTSSEKNGIYTETGKYTGQCIGKIYFDGNTIGSGLAKYTNTYTGNWNEETYDYAWSEIPQAGSITGISGWLSGDAEDDDPYAYEDTLEYYPSNPQADYQDYSVYDDLVSGPILYFYDQVNNVSYYGNVDFNGPFFNEQNDATYYPNDPWSDFQSVSLVSIEGGFSEYRYDFYDSSNDVTYYSLVQFEDLEYYTYDYNEEEEDSVLIQGSILTAGKGTPIRLLELSDSVFY